MYKYTSIHFYKYVIPETNQYKYTITYIHTISHPTQPCMGFHIIFKRREYKIRLYVPRRKGRYNQGIFNDVGIYFEDKTFKIYDVSRF